MYSRGRHPPKTVSPRPYCRSRKGRNGLGSETILNMTTIHQNIMILGYKVYLVVVFSLKTGNLLVFQPAKGGIE